MVKPVMVAQDTLTTSKYGADRQRVEKHNVLQRTGFEPTSIAIKAESAAFRPPWRWRTVLETRKNERSGPFYWRLMYSRSNVDIFTVTPIVLSATLPNKRESATTVGGSFLSL